MQYLRQSTASQEISLGQFLDASDGNTELNALSIANTDIKMRRHGVIGLFDKTSGGASTVGNGVYVATLDATDTATAGMLEVYVHVATSLPVKSVFNVLPAASYDAIFSIGLPVATSIVTGGAIVTNAGSVVTTDNVGGLPTFPANFADLSITASTGLVDVAPVAFDNVWTAASRTLTANTNLNDIDAAAVKTQIVEALTVDTYAEPAAAPTATSSLKDKLVWLFTINKNKVTQTSGTQTIRNDADNADIATSAVSDDNTTAIRDKYV